VHKHSCIRTTLSDFHSCCIAAQTDAAEIAIAAGSIDISGFVNQLGAAQVVNDGHFDSL
jgi:hypothetical protein